MQYVKQVLLLKVTEEKVIFFTRQSFDMETEVFSE